MQNTNEVDDIVFEIVDGEDDPRKDELKKSLREFNESIIGKYTSKTKVILSLKDDRVIGGIVGYMTLGWLHIDLLCVEERYRKKGIGKKLLSAIEKIAKSNNIYRSKLNTGNFQTGYEFYLSQGYEEFTKLAITPEFGESTTIYYDYYMKKDLSK